MELIYETSNRLCNSVHPGRRRYLYDLIDWSDRLIEIRGARGTGKTTLMLQRVRELNEGHNQVAVYAAMDNPWFYSGTAYDLAGEVSRMGGKFLFLDEVHKYPSKKEGTDWSAEIKAIYDAYPDLHLVYSGSSVLALYRGQGDLSRRRSVYHLKGLSFREFLSFEKVADLSAVSLNDLIEDHIGISGEMMQTTKIFPYFQAYIQHGYYPFYQESSVKYFERLNDVISVVLETDMPTVSDITYSTIQRIKKLLAAIGSTVPYTPNLSTLRSELYIADHRTILSYLNMLDKAELITSIDKHALGNQILHKPEKIYLNNTNLLYALPSEFINIGTVRETFFMNQVSSVHRLTLPDRGDFLVDGKYTFEVGGRNKSPNQLRNVEKAFLALDDIETGVGNRIPLWLFGFLY